MHVTNSFELFVVVPTSWSQLEIFCRAETPETVRTILLYRALPKSRSTSRTQKVLYWPAGVSDITVSKCSVA